MHFEGGTSRLHVGMRHIEASVKTKMRKTAGWTGIKVQKGSLLEILRLRCLLGMEKPEKE